MAEIRIELTGWKAIVAGVLLIGLFAGYRVYSHLPNVSGGGARGAPDLAGQGLHRQGSEGCGASGSRIIAPGSRPNRWIYLPLCPTFNSCLSRRMDGAMPWLFEPKFPWMADRRPTASRSGIFSLTTKFEGGWMVLSESDSYRYYRALF